jgi:hypothetical protein
MRKLLVLILMLAFTCGVSRAQDDNAEATPIPEDIPEFTAVVEVESTFVRALPAPDAEPVASVFELDPLEAVGRNLDGTWFEVRRPGRMSNLGWISEEKIEWDFYPEYLPLRDLTTGVIGPNPLTEDPGFAVHAIEGVTLRNRPVLQGSTRITTVPPGSTVPLLERNQDGSWLHVNYLGYDGWIIAFATRPIPNILDVPIAPNLPPLETISVIIIPPEIQLAQVERLRTYVNERLGLARAMEAFWWSVFRGEILPCDAPPPIPQYQVSDQDVRELPELDRYLPQLNTGVARLNSAIAPLNVCGVVTPDDVYAARDDAINARIIFVATLGRLDILEEVIR